MTSINDKRKTKIVKFLLTHISIKYLKLEDRKNDNFSKDDWTQRKNIIFMQCRTGQDQEPEEAQCAPITYVNHQSDFEVDLIVYLGYFCSNHVAFQIMTSVSLYLLCRMIQEISI